MEKISISYLLLPLEAFRPLGLRLRPRHIPHLVGHKVQHIHHLPEWQSRMSINCTKLPFSLYRLVGLLILNGLCDPGVVGTVPGADGATGGELAGVFWNKRSLTSGGLDSTVLEAVENEQEWAKNIKLLENLRAKAREKLRLVEEWSIWELQDLFGKVFCEGDVWDL